MALHVNKKVEEVGSSVTDDPKLIATLLKRNLAEVFGENDPERRRAAISEIYAEDAVVHAPPGTIAGHDALNKFAGELRSPATRIFCRRQTLARHRRRTSTRHRSHSWIQPVTLPSLAGC